MSRESVNFNFSNKNALRIGFALVVCFIILPANADIASKSYVERIVGATTGPAKTTVVNASSTDDQYPTAKSVYTYVQGAVTGVTVTKESIGLGNVQNVDQTNANNITSGTVAAARLPIGTTAATTVADGNDKRFYAVPTSAPAGNAPSGWAWVWIAP